MNLKTYLNTRKKLIDKRLDGYLPPETEMPAALHKAMRYSVFPGGKRIRPIIAVESCMACGGRLRDGLVAACALEFVHTYSLIHDDLPAMDDDDYRRGKLSCHRVFGEANAILAGDALLTMAFDVLSRDLSSSKAVSAIKELSKAIGTKGMVGGQALDLESKDKEKSKGAQERINRLKTSMLFEASCRLGAIAAGAGSRETGAAAHYGASLGMIFQLTDDMIDGAYDGDISKKAKARRGIKILLKKTKSSLRVFGSKASRLAEIADYVAGRLQ